MSRTWLGCTTSIDQVLQQQQLQQYNTTTSHGVKRPLEQTSIDSRHDFVPGNSIRNPSIQGTGEWKYPDAGSKGRLTASKICFVKTGSETFPDPSFIRQQALPVPGPSQNPLLSLGHPRYGLPQTLVRNFCSLGIRSIYPWQSSCLLGRGLLDGSKNLVYTAPTGGGKSLVADVLMLKRIIEDPIKKAILVLPYVALVQEKMKWLRKAVEGVQKDGIEATQSHSELPPWRKPHDRSVHVAGFFGGSKSKCSWRDIDIAVCTIEKVT